MKRVSGLIFILNNGKPAALVRLIMACALLVSPMSRLCAQEKNEIVQTYQKKASLQLKGLSGSKIQISSGEADHIEIRLANYNNPKFEYSIKEEDQTLIISEDIIDYNGKEPTPKSKYGWSIVLPIGTHVRANGATCDVRLIHFSGTWICQFAKCDALIEKTKGQIQISAAELDAKIFDAEGCFDFSAARGDVEAEAINLTGASTFTTGHGNVEINLSQTVKHDLVVGSSFGRAVLNYQDHPVEGSFEFIARADKGKILSPYHFDVEEVFKSDKKQFKKESDFGEMVDYWKKSFVRGNRNPKITLKAVTGTVELLMK